MSRMPNLVVTWKGKNFPFIGNGKDARRQRAPLKVNNPLSQI